MDASSTLSYNDEFQLIWTQPACEIKMQMVEFSTDIYP